MENVLKKSKKEVMSELTVFIEQLKNRLNESNMKYDSIHGSSLDKFILCYMYEKYGFKTIRLSNKEFVVRELKGDSN